MNTTTLASTTRPSPAQVARLVLGLFKLRIGVLIMVTALGGLAASPGGASLAFGQVLVINDILGLDDAFALATSAAPMSCPAKRMLSRSTMFASSRTLPGQR